MLRSRFFWKLYVAFAILVVITLTATGVLLHRRLRPTLLADVETRLLDMATSMVPYAADVFARRDQLQAAGAGAVFDATTQAEVELMGRQTETRITLVAPDGWVVADSDRDPRQMDNHGTRPEIVASASQPYGVSRRFSNTVRQDLLYVAITVRDGEQVVGVVRTSVPLVAVDARLAALRNTIAIGAGLGVVIAMLIGLFVAHRITSPVTQMTAVAEALREGRYERRVVRAGTDEIGLLGSTLNRLADELTHRIATLAEQRAQLGAMISGLHEGVFAVDEHDNLIFHNNAADRLLGLEKGGNITDFWRRVDVPDIGALCASARRGGGSARAEVLVERDGVDYILDTRATPFATDGQRGVVVVLHDISNLRRLERVRTEFVANVSHELKTPLTSIRAYVETLIGGAIHDDANNLRFLKKIEQQVDRLTAMVTDVLSLARIEATEGEQVTRTVDWRPVVEAVVERYREQGKLQGHACALDLSSSAVLIAGDVESMTQVLDNLLDNAIKYTPAGGKITVRAYNDDGCGILEVEDTGIGISTADRERIFERFFRTDRARSRDTGGTGLGLSIVKHLVQGFGGDISVTSRLGYGSKFSVCVPAPTVPAA